MERHLLLLATNLGLGSTADLGLSVLKILAQLTGSRLLGFGQTSLVHIDDKYICLECV